MRWVIFLYLVVFVLGGVVFYFLKTPFNKIISPLGKIPIEKPLDKYTFVNLHKKIFSQSDFHIGKLLKDEDTFASYIFDYKVDGKKVTGLMNIPKEKGIYPVLVLFRGYVDLDKYSPGEGTRRTAEYFASQGYITLAPDFLGYGDSDNPSQNPMEERFQTYTTAATLLGSLPKLPKALSQEKTILAVADPNKIGIWGHSNGGHIALAVLEITGKSYPTVLWAPVSKPFPYSILYYTDEFDDHGKALRKVLANFEKEYDAEKYSLTNYFDWIQAPISLHQGEADESVPVAWSNQLVSLLKEKKKDVAYFTYPGENHNFNNGSWETAVERSIDFYQKQGIK